MPDQEFTYSIIKSFGQLSTSRSGWNREVNSVSWNGGKPKLDIRDWAPDHSKMGKNALVRTCGIEEIDVLITDRRTPEEYVEAFRVRGAECIVV